jgi:transcriptional regulator with XRE-family HTH domain
MLNGCKVREYIRKRGLTQAKFASKVGLSTPTISKLINYNTCDLDTLIAVADAMNVPLDYLFDRNVNNEKHDFEEKIKPVEIFDQEEPISGEKILLLVEFNKENIVKLNLRDRVLHILND